MTEGKVGRGVIIPRVTAGDCVWPQQSTVDDSSGMLQSGRQSDLIPLPVLSLLCSSCLLESSTAATSSSSSCIQMWAHSHRHYLKWMRHGPALDITDVLPAAWANLVKDNLTSTLWVQVKSPDVEKWLKCTSKRKHFRSGKQEVHQPGCCSLLVPGSPPWNRDRRTDKPSKLISRWNRHQIPLIRSSSGVASSSSATKALPVSSGCWQDGSRAGGRRAGLLFLILCLSVGDMSFLISLASKVATGSWLTHLLQRKALYHKQSSQII